MSGEYSIVAKSPNREASLSVSVVMTTFNRAHYLSIALDSLLDQTSPVNEIIVVNDASDDETAAVLDGYVERFGPIIQPINLEQNRGKPAGLNLAIPKVESDYIWLFDDDDAALPTAANDHRRFLEANPTVDISYSDKYIFVGSGDIWQRTSWTISRLPQIEPHELLVRSMLSMNTLFQGMFIPTRCFAEVGPFDESLKRCEDHEMLLRMARYYHAANLGKPTFVYREHAAARGTGAETHSGEQRFRIMMDYKERIFRDVRDRYPLGCYLPKKNTDNTTALSDEDTARALLQRSSVMLRHGLVSEGLADLDTALATCPAAVSTTPWGPAILSQAVDVEPWVWPEWRRDLRQLNQVAVRHRDRGIARFLLRGFYWNLRRELKRSKRGQAATAGMLLGYFGLLISTTRSRVPGR